MVPHPDDKCQVLVGWRNVIKWLTEGKIKKYYLVICWIFTLYPRGSEYLKFIDKINMFILIWTYVNSNMNLCSLCYEPMFIIIWTYVHSNKYLSLELLMVHTIYFAILLWKGSKGNSNSEISYIWKVYRIFIQFWLVFLFFCFWMDYVESLFFLFHPNFMQIFAKCSS